MAGVKTSLILVLPIFPAAAGIKAQTAGRATGSESPAPVAVSALKPGYPVPALVEKADVEVPVDVKIDAAGRVSEADFVSGHQLFKKAVIEAALKWKFEPETDAAGPRRARLTFVFHLSDDDYQPPDPDQIARRRRIDIYFEGIGDCFNDCGDF